MKIIPWILLLCMVTNAFGSATDSAIRSSVEEFEYSLTVDWDQKDQASLEKIMGKFKSDLEALKKKGMTDQELLSYIESRATDKKQIERLRAKILLEQPSASPEAMANFFRAELASLKVQGASWNGEAIFSYGFSAVLVGILIYATISMMADGKRTKEQNAKTCLVASNYESCDEEYRCTAYSYTDDGYGGRDSTCVGGVYDWVCRTKARCEEWAP